MFGITYQTKCPNCGQVYMADHGGTCYYKIKGKEYLGEYCEEVCHHCGKKYLCLCVDEEILGYKNSGKTLEEAIEFKKQSEIIRHKPFSGRESLRKDQIEDIEMACKHVYENVNIEDLYAYYEKLKEGELIISNIIFW